MDPTEQVPSALELQLGTDAIPETSCFSGLNNTTRWIKFIKSVILITVHQRQNHTEFS
jgi:hypothetical protein